MPDPDAFKSEYLRASAGSGKTYRLSVRYCQLAAQVPPETICALTFTRAAAREIFTAIIKRLLDDKEGPGTPESRRQTLAAILWALPKLQISTIDAWTMKLAHLFACELGISPDFDTYEEGSRTAIEAERAAVRRACEAAGADVAGLLRTLNPAEEGEGPAKALSAQLCAFFRAWRERWLEHHEKDWGTLEPFKPLPKRNADREAALAVLMEQPARGGWSHKRYAKWVESLRDLAGSQDEKLQCCSCYDHKFDDASLAALRALRQDYARSDIEAAARRTQRHAATLTRLAAAHAAWSAETGRLTFSEATALLAERLGGELDTGVLHQRLDAQVRHLMIDEFQDTSREQWKVLRTLASELTSKEGSSFFYVGDVKQSIYGWRGGDSTLFADPARMPQGMAPGKPLLLSRRSCKVIVDFVNALFDLSTKASSSSSPWREQAVKRWMTEWEAHVPADAQRLGCVRVVSLQDTQEGKGRSSRGVWVQALAREIARRWRELAGASLTMAVLAYDGKTLQGDEQEPGLLQHLREEGVPCALDGKLRLSETPFGRWIVAMLRWLADPRATLWREVAQQVGVADGEAALASWMACIASRGYAAWLEEVSAGLPLAPADREAFRHLRAALERLDAQGVLEPREAVKEIEALAVPCVGSKHVLSLMTIHHSKGLTFDVVFTVLAGDMMTNDSLRPFETGETWLLEKPAFKHATYAEVPALAAARDDAWSKEFFERLCTLYVSLTRAKSEQTVFVLNGELARDSDKAETKAKFLLADFLTKHGVDCGARERETELCYESGDSTWWRQWEEKSAPEPKSRPSAAWTAAKASVPGIEVDLPSEHRWSVPLSDLFKGRVARAQGTQIHEQLAAVAWLDDDSPIPEALAQSPKMRQIFRRPAASCEVWRERSFSAVVESSQGNAVRYLAGQFDRVHLFPETRQAVIYDFKTSREPFVSEGYRRQLAGYRKALARLTGWPQENIRTVLLFVCADAAVEVAHD